MNEPNLSALSASFDRPSFRAFAPAFMSTSSGATMVADTPTQDLGVREGGTMDMDSGERGDAIMPSTVEGTMDDVETKPSPKMTMTNP